MLGLAGIPSLIMFVGLLFMPETPRWLVFHGKTTKARQTLARVREPSKVSEELNSILTDYKEYQELKMGKKWSGLEIKAKVVVVCE